MCNESIVLAADTTVPTACGISINNDSSYANEKYVTLNIYAKDESDMQFRIGWNPDTGWNEEEEKSRIVVWQPFNWYGNEYAPNIPSGADLPGIIDNLKIKLQEKRTTSQNDKDR